MVTFTRVAAVVAALAATVAAAPTAMAATPAEIAADIKDGRLDAVYSRAELEAYVRTPLAQGYGNPVRTPASASGVAGVQTRVTQSRVTQSRGRTASPVLAETGEAGTLPFTGADLALFAAGGWLILLVGFAVRRAGNARA